MKLRLLSLACLHAPTSWYAMGLQQPRERAQQQRNSSILYASGYLHVLLTHPRRAQIVLMPLWSRVVTALILFSDATEPTELCRPTEPARSVSLITTGRHLKSIAVGIFLAVLPPWRAAHFARADQSGAQAAIVELCLAFAVLWTLRSVHLGLSGLDDEDKLALVALDALKAAGFTHLPEHQRSWNRCVHPATEAWTSWTEISPLQLSSPMPTCANDAQLMIPSMAMLGQHALVGFIAAGGGHTLVLGAHWEVHKLQTVLQHCPIDAYSQLSAHRVAVDCCAATRAVHAQARALLFWRARAVFDRAGSGTHVVACVCNTSVRG